MDEHGGPYAEGKKGAKEKTAAHGFPCVLTGSCRKLNSEDNNGLPDVDMYGKALNVDQRTQYFVRIRDKMYYTEW